MSDSVGKISLDLEIQSDISAQISNVSNLIAKNLKKSLSGGMKSALENVNTTTKKTMGNMFNSINSSVKKSVGNIGKTLRNILGNIKMPKIDIPKPTNISMPKTSNISSTISNRGPPDIEGLKDARLGKIQELDITDRQIDNLRNKLKFLNEQLSSTFNKQRKNKLEAQILSTESRMNSLINKSIRLGSEVTKLDSKIEELGNESLKTGNKIGLFNNLLSRGSNTNKKFSNSIKSSSKSIGSYRTGIGNTIGQMFKWMIILPMIVKGLTAFATALGQGLMTNQQFANSFNQIKTNMQVAFTPILQAILPALNTLMAALAKATTYIASFISAIFGKTYQQSYQATQQLIDAKVAMGAYGDSAKKAAKDVKGLAAIDEINTLGAANANIAGTNNKIPQLVAPPVDTSAVDSAMKSLVDRIKRYFSDISFVPLINSFKNLKSAIVPIVNNLGKILKWFMDNILKPLTKWTIEDALPAFFNLLSGALRALNPILEVFMDLGAWLWDEFLQPIASWTGGVIVDALNGLANGLSKLGDWINENKPIVEIFAIVVGSFALAWGLVNAALAIWNGVGVIAAGVTTALGVAFEFATSKVGRTTLIIGAVIAIGVLLYKHWDEIKAKAIEVWDSIKEKFNQFKEWLGNVFATDWSQKFGFLGDILNAFLTSVKNIFDGVKRFFSGIIDFVAGVFTGNWDRAWKGVKDIFGGIWDSFVGIAKAPINMIIGLINGMISAINVAIRGINKLSWTVPDWVPIIGGNTWGFDIPQLGKVPYLAKGGIIDSPTLAMVGEAGKEAVVPLENNTQGLDLLADKLLERFGGTNISDSDKDKAINIILKIGDLEFARVLIDSINKITKMNGGECLINI